MKINLNMRLWTDFFRKKICASSLVEVLVTMTILMIGVGGFLKFISQYKNNRLTVCTLKFNYNSSVERLNNCFNSRDIGVQQNDNIDVNVRVHVEDQKFGLKRIDYNEHSDILSKDLAVTFFVVDME